MILTEKHNLNFYNTIFKERFNKSTNLSDPSENIADFFTDYTKEILKQYKNIINSKKRKDDNNYIIREKIRLEVNIKNLETQKFDFTYSMQCITVIITLLLFGMTQSVNYFSEAVKFPIENVLKTVKNVRVINEYSNIFKKWSYNMADLIMNYSLYLILGSGVAIIIMSAVSYHRKKRNDVRIAFNRICLEVLNKFENELKYLDEF